MMAFPRILVIIVTWNKKDYVLGLLDSLAQLDYPTDRLDLLVVDNASSDGTSSAIKERFPDIRLLVNRENLGGSGGFNTGLAWAFKQEESCYDYYWLLDNDVLVHRRALGELVGLLEEQPNIAVAGSTMLQLDYPWRINEMGAYVDRTRGTLFLNRHHEEVLAWQGRDVQDLLLGDGDLTRRLVGCTPHMDVEYVAAASLVIRARVARAAGLWRDFFIHLDDVEWCLRITRMGYRVAVSARSLIWHLSAAAKVPTWVLYYDNRNVLYLLGEYGAPGAVEQSKGWIRKKALYYIAIGKPGLARLHQLAIEDFENGRVGKRAIDIAERYRSVGSPESSFMDPSVRRILIPWPLNLLESGLQESIVNALAARRGELTVDCLALPGASAPPYHARLPGAGIVHLPAKRLWRWLTLLRWYQRYDLVLQSDYEILPALTWSAREILFVNDEGILRMPRPRLGKIRTLLTELFLLRNRSVEAAETSSRATDSAPS